MSSSPLWEYASMLARREADRILDAKAERDLKAKEEADIAANAAEDAKWERGQARERAIEEREEEEFYSGRRESNETHYGVRGLFGRD